MAKQELLDKIIEDAEARSREILAEAKSKADALLAAAEEECRVMLDGVRKIASSTRPESIKRAKSMAELEVRKEILAAKQQQIADAYKAALESIRASKDYPLLLTKMILSSAEEGDSVLFAACDEGKVDFAKIVAAASKESGKHLTLAKEQGDFSGGIVLRGKDCDKNLSLEVELDALRSEEEICAKVLFG